MARRAQIDTCTASSAIISGPDSSSPFDAIRGKLLPALPEKTASPLHLGNLRKELQSRTLLFVAEMPA